jgi:hypothetical protein
MRRWVQLYPFSAAPDVSHGDTHPRVRNCAHEEFPNWGTDSLQQITSLHAKDGRDALEGLKGGVLLCAAFDVAPTLAPAKVRAVRRLFLRQSELLAQPLNLRNIEGHTLQNGIHGAPTLADVRHRVHIRLDMSRRICTIGAKVMPRRFSLGRPEHERGTTGRSDDTAE